MAITINLNLSTTNVLEGTNLYFTTSRVLGTTLGGLSITGGSIVSTDTVLQAFGKTQNQINGLLGGAMYQGVWNASTNSPALSSGVGTKGYYYVVNVNGSTNLDGITDWKVGDWAIFNGTTWDKVDNTDAVSSVNGAIGAVSIAVTGTSNRIDVTGGAGVTPTIDISSNYAGQTSITTLGTVTTGTLGNGVKVLLGSDQTGDVYYNGGSGVLSRSDSFNYASATPTLLVNGTTANSYFDTANRGFFVVSGGSTSHGWNPIFTAGIGTGFPSIQLYSSTSTNYSTIFWQSASHTAATTSATGNLAVISCFENGTKAVWRLAVADPFGGGFTPIRIFQTLGQNIALGSGGTATPTSYVHFAAGAAGIGKSFAKYTSGVKLGTAEVGAWEFVTDDLFFTGTTGTTRKTIADYAYVAKTANYTLTGADNLVNCTANSFTITLPTAVGYTKEYIIKNTGSGTITLNTTSSQTIDGNASGTLNLLQNEFMRVRSNGTNWIIVG